MSDETKQNSPTWTYVADFAEKMEAQLARNREKGDRPGWLAAHPGRLYEKVQQKADDLGRAGDADTAWKDAADLANYAMMLADRYANEELQRKKHRAHEGR